MTDDTEPLAFDDEYTRRERRRAQFRAAKRKARAAGGTVGKKVAVQIELTREEYLLLCSLESQARDPKDFRKLALLQGAKFRSNTGRGRGKFKSD